MKQGPQEEPVTYHRPEFIILEDERKESSFEQKKQEQYEALFKNLKKIESTWAVRLMTLIGFCVTAVAAVFSVFFVAFNLLIATLTLFRSVQINQAANKSWKTFKKILTCCVGLGIAVFSPFLGFGLIVLYFISNNEPIDPRLMSRFMK